MAEYVYGFLRQQSESLWEQYRLKNALKGAAPKISFQTGVVAGFKRKLDQIENSQRRGASVRAGDASASGQAIPVMEAESKSKSLVRFNDPGLRQFVQSRFPRLTSVRTGARVLGEHYDSGRVQGERIVIHKGISTQGSGTRALLGPSRN